MSDQLMLEDIWAQSPRKDDPSKAPAIRLTQPVRNAITRTRYSKDKSELLQVSISKKEKDAFFEACAKRGVIPSQVVRDLVEFWVVFEWIGREANVLK